MKHNDSSRSGQRLAGIWPEWPEPDRKQEPVAETASKWPDWRASGAAQPFSSREKNRETKNLRKPARKRASETNREPTNTRNIRVIRANEPTVEPKHKPKSPFEFASINVH